MDQRVRAAISLMNTNLHRKLTPIDIAQSVRLSLSHLRQLFKRETGVPIARYGRQLRLAEARKLLRNTFLSVKEVAASVGIAGLSHFVRDFKKAYGATPARYAARYRKASQSKGLAERRDR